MEQKYWKIVTEITEFGTKKDRITLSLLAERLDKEGLTKTKRISPTFTYTYFPWSIAEDIFKYIHPDVYISTDWHDTNVVSVRMTKSYGEPYKAKARLEYPITDSDFRPIAKPTPRDYENSLQRGKVKLIAIETGFGIHLWDSPSQTVAKEAPIKKAPIKKAPIKKTVAKKAPVKKEYVDFGKKPDSLGANTPEPKFTKAPDSVLKEDKIIAKGELITTIIKLIQADKSGSKGKLLKDKYTIAGPPDLKKADVKLLTVILGDLSDK